MGLLDKVKASAEQAASTAQKQAQTVATKRELSQAYNELGKTAFELIESGEISNSRFDATAATIRGLAGKLADDGAEGQPYDASQPPAMPT